MQLTAANGQTQDLTIDLQTVEALSRHELQRQTTTPRFEFDGITPRDALNVLAGYYAARVRGRDHDVTWDADTVSHLKEMALYMTDSGDSRNGLMMAGTVGNGKSTLMWALARAIEYLDSTTGAFAYLTDPRSMYTEHPRLTILGARDIAMTVKEPEKFEKIKRTHYLGIDDLGTDPTEVMDYGELKTPLVELIEYRYERRLFTVITTNLLPDQIEAKYGSRIRDRLREMCLKISFGQNSYR